MKSSVAITTILATATLAAPLSWCEKGGKVVDCNKMYNPKCSLGGKVIDCDNMAEEMDKMLDRINNGEEVGNTQFSFGLGK